MGADVGVKKGPRSDINITPLVDVVLVLLIIFMVLTPLMEKEMAIRVPEEPDKNVPVPPPSPDDPPQYIFRVQDDGKFSFNNQPIAEDKVVEELGVYYKSAKAREHKDGPPIMFFDADDKAKYVRAMRALDLIRDSGTGKGWTIGMMTEKLPPPAPPAAPEGAAPAEGGAPAPAAPPEPPK